ncbi:MAG: LeuD/DmdB family oxidoreductase small subunit [Caulobacterales bacterium]|uniref:LeuD/DmdB family oxidoreductase small subunit n=1 Tax=Glycocaulis sp. TaxID=1969725 RepID=UPI003F9F3A31
MNGVQTGQAFVYGDRIDTDVLAPGHAMKLGPEGLARHCLEAIDPGFSARVKPGDFLIAGEDFGIGSSREQAAISLKRLGIAAIFARSYARIFFRNAINIGLPAYVLDHPGFAVTGDVVNFDWDTGKLTNPGTGATATVTPMPHHLKTMIEAGGLMESLKARFGAREPIS